VARIAWAATAGITWAWVATFRFDAGRITWGRVIGFGIADLRAETVVAFEVQGGA
jgi:hypothetical protein